MEPEQLFSAREQVLYSIPLERLEPILKKWIREVFKETSQCHEASKAHPENLSLDQAVLLLTENGYPTTKANIYRMSSKNEIPCARIGKRLIFSKTQLLAWLESRSISKVNIMEETVMSVAKSARNIQQLNHENKRRR